MPGNTRYLRLTKLFIQQEDLDYMEKNMGATTKKKPFRYPFISRQNDGGYFSEHEVEIWLCS